MCTRNTFMWIFMRLFRVEFLNTWWMTMTEIDPIYQRQTKLLYLEWIISKMLGVLMTRFKFRKGVWTGFQQNTSTLRYCCSMSVCHQYVNVWFSLWVNQATMTRNSPEQRWWWLRKGTRNSLDHCVHHSMCVSHSTSLHGSRSHQATDHFHIFHRQNQQRRESWFTRCWAESCSRSPGVAGFRSVLPCKNERKGPRCNGMNEVFPSRRPGISWKRLNTAPFSPSQFPQHRLSARGSPLSPFNIQRK